MASEEGGRRIQSIGIGMSVLQVVESQPGLPLRDIALQVDMPRSKVHLYLATLVHSRLLARDAAGCYFLGPYALELGLAALRQLNVVDVSDDALRELRNKTQHSVHLSVWGNRGPTVVRKVDGVNRGPLSIRVGVVLPVLSSATGRIFAAHLPWVTIEPIIKVEPDYERLGKSQIESLLSETRARGTATGSNRLNQGYTALSVPVFDHQQDICAALTVLDETQSVDVDLGHATAASLVRAATMIGTRLGSPATR